MKLNDFYFTFGSGQPNFPGYVKIKAVDKDTARKLMIKKYGTRWSVCYTSLTSLHPYDRKQIDIITQNIKSYNH